MQSNYYDCHYNRNIVSDRVHADPFLKEHLRKIVKYNYQHSYVIRLFISIIERLSIYENNISIIYIVNEGA